MERLKHPQKLGHRLDEPDTCEASLVVLFDGWLDDLLRLHASAVRHSSADWELVVVDNPVDDDASEAIAGLERTVHVPLRDHVGWAAGRNLGLRLARGRIAIVADTSVEATGDVVDALARSLEDPGVGLAGRWGVTTSDGFSFAEAPGPDVDGVEAYLMAARRSLLREVGLFDPKFRWYRNADIDFSFQVRDHGYRTIVDVALPVVRHTHRLWESTPQDEREDASRRNFGRFRQHWGERTDLIQSSRP